MNSRIPESLVQPFVQQFWQVSILVLIVAAIASFVGHRRPHLAYLLWLLVAVKCVTPPMIGSPTSIFSLSRAVSSVPLATAEKNIAIREENQANNVGDATALATDGTRERVSLETISPIADSPRSATVQTTIKTPWQWSNFLLIGWFGGALVYGSYLSLHWWRFQRIVARGTTPDAEVMRIYEELLDEFRLPKTTELVRVDEPFGPAVVGCLRPKIVLPSQLLEEATSSELRSILYHELTHVRRRDVWMSWLQVAAGTVWWFHPLIWYANRQIVRWREASCDEEVIAGLAIQPRRYVDALLRVLEARVQPFPAMQIGMAVGESTERRLVRLMKRSSYCRSTPAWCWFVLLAASFVVLPGAAWSWQANDRPPGNSEALSEKPASKDVNQFVPEPEDGEATGPATGQLILVGRPADGETHSVAQIQQTLTISGTAVGPNVAGARIQLLRMKGDNVIASSSTSADSSGRFVFEQGFEVDRYVPLPQEIMILRGTTDDGVTVWKEWQLATTSSGLELVEVTDNFGLFQFSIVSDDPSATQIKGKKSVDIEIQFPTETATVTGVLRDHAGNPVADASITTVAIFNSPRPNLEMDSNDGKSIMASFPVVSHVTQLRDGLQVSTRTSADGSWTLGKFAVGKGLDIAATVPDSATSVARINTSAGATSVSVQLPESKTCTLTVLDDLTGKPVPFTRAHVSQQVQQEPLRMANATGTTDNQGRIVLHLPQGQSTLHLVPGTENPLFNYQSNKTISVSNATQDLQVRMDTGALLEFHVVDDATGKAFPFMPVRPTQNETLTIKQSTEGREQLETGVTLLECLPGKAKFTVPRAAIQGYEILNPMNEPMAIPAGSKTTYTFRLRRMNEYRPPVDEDNTADFSVKHQTAVARLRKLGALVRTVGNPKEAHCEVTLSQFWQGKPEDLRWLADLEFFKVLHCIAYPVPIAFQNGTQPEPPVVTDDWLLEIGKSTDLDYAYFARSTITDEGLAALAGCKQLHTLFIQQSQIKGHGFESLASVPLQSLIVTSSTFDLADVNLVRFADLVIVHFASDDSRAIIPPRGGPKLKHANIAPANAQTFERLSEYPELQFIFVKGPEVTDAVLKNSPVCQRVDSLSLMNTGVTDVGLSILAQSKLSSLHLEGDRFTDAAVPHLLAIPILKRVSLKNTSMTEAAVAKLKSGKPELSVVMVPNGAN